MWGGFTAAHIFILFRVAAHHERSGRDFDEAEQVFSWQIPGIRAETRVAQAGEGISGLAASQGGMAAVSRHPGQKFSLDG